MPDRLQETPKSAAAFRDYCDLGPSRSMAKLAQKLGKPTGYTRTLEEWSSKYAWVDRAKQFDAEQAEERRLKQQQEIEAMNQRHVLIGTTQQARAIKQIEELIAAKKFGSQAVVQLLKLSLDTERLARGAPTERSEVTGKDGEPITAGANVIFYLPKLDEEKGGDADAYSPDSNS